MDIDLGFQVSVDTIAPAYEQNRRNGRMVADLLAKNRTTVDEALECLS